MNCLLYYIPCKLVGLSLAFFYGIDCGSACYQFRLCLDVQIFFVLFWALWELGY